jgi:hypothetical protein
VENLLRISEKVLFESLATSDNFLPSLAITPEQKKHFLLLIFNAYREF